jgi:hypothetical protein
MKNNENILIYKILNKYEIKFFPTKKKIIDSKRIKIMISDLNLVNIN